MRNSYFFSENVDTQKATQELLGNLTEENRSAQLAFLFYDCTHDADIIRSSVNDTLGDGLLPPKWSVN